MSITNKAKVPVKAGKIKELRKEQGYSHQQLADKIDELIKEEKCSDKITKSSLHRAEGGDGNQKPALRLTQIRGLALALGVSEEALVVSELPNVRPVDLRRVTEGKKFLESLRRAELVSFEVAFEPADEKAQLAILEFLSSSDKEYKERQIDRDFFETTKSAFSFRRQLDVLAKDNIFVFAENVRQIRPFNLSKTGFEEWECVFDDLSKEKYDEVTNGEFAFDGSGFCDLLVIKIDNSVYDFITHIVDLNPIDLGHSDPFLIENLERLNTGIKELDISEYRNEKMPLSEFVSQKARDTEEKQRIFRANHPAPDF